MIIALFFIIFLFAFSTDFHSLFFPVTSRLHLYCLTTAPQSTWTQAYQAIVCAQNLTSKEFKDALIVTGLIHLIVVSGSHLILLKKLLNKTFGTSRPINFLISFLLLTYCGVCKLEPPVVRAFLALMLFFFNKKFKLFWSPLQTTLFSGLLCLSLFPEWFFSKSLILSWLASLSLHYSRNNIINSIVCYLALFPILLEFSPLSPWTIVINSLFSPIIGFLLFPLSTLSFFIPGFPKITDRLWQSLSDLTSFLQNFLSLERTSFEISFPIEVHWLFLFSLSWFMRRRKKVK